MIRRVRVLLALALLVVAVPCTSALATPDQPTWWTLAGPGNTSTTFTVSQSVTLSDPHEGHYWPQLTIAPGTTYVGYIVQRQSDRKLVAGEVQNVTGAFAGKYAWMQFGRFDQAAVLAPGVPYRITLVSDKAQSMRFEVKRTSLVRNLRTSRPEAVAAVTKDVVVPPMVEGSTESRVAMPVLEGATVGAAAVFEDDTVGATYRANACLSPRGVACPNGLDLTFIGPAANTWVGAWRIYDAERMPHPVEEAVGIVGGTSVPSRTTVFGFTLK